MYDDIYSTNSSFEYCNCHFRFGSLWRRGRKKKPTQQSMPIEIDPLRLSQAVWLCFWRHNGYNQPPPPCISSLSSRENYIFFCYIFSPRKTQIGHRLTQRIEEKKKRQRIEGNNQTWWNNGTTAPPFLTLLLYREADFFFFFLVWLFCIYFALVLALLFDDFCDVISRSRPRSVSPDEPPPPSQKKRIRKKKKKTPFEKSAEQKPICWYLWCLTTPRYV